MIPPKKIKRGDTIGLITPASAVSEENFQKAVTNVESLGFKAFYYPSVMDRAGYLAGSDLMRKQELEKMFENKNVDAILCVRGGYGTMRLLSAIDYNIIKRNPKIFAGYSDITALLNAIYRFTGLFCFHSPMAVSDFSEYTKKCFIDLLCFSQNNYLISAAQLSENFAFPQPLCVNGGKAQGRLVGGNLSLIVSLLGTPYEPEFENNILFLEDVGEEPYRIDRMMTQLFLSGKIQKTAAVILGVFENCNSKENNSPSFQEMVLPFFETYRKPVVINFSFGHTTNNCTLPIGALAEIDANNLQLKILEFVVKN